MHSKHSTRLTYCNMNVQSNVSTGLHLVHSTHCTATAHYNVHLQCSVSALNGAPDAQYTLNVYRSRAVNYKVKQWCISCTVYTAHTPHSAMCTCSVL